MDHLYSRTSVYLPAQLKRIRKKLGLSTLEFARNCQLSVTTINRLENDLDVRVPAKFTWNKVNLFLKRIQYFEKFAKSDDEDLAEQLEEAIRENKPKIQAVPTPGIQTRWITPPMNLLH